jgi:hypothetical protein
VDVVQVADQIGRRLGIAYRRFVEATFRMRVACDPFPMQDLAVLFEERFRADDARFQR